MSVVYGQFNSTCDKGEMFIVHFTKCISDWPRAHEHGVLSQGSNYRGELHTPVGQKMLDTEANIKN